MTMGKFKLLGAASAIGLLASGQAFAQSAGSGDTEVSLLKQQLRLMEQKLDKLEKKSTETSATAANAQEKALQANAKATSTDAKIAANANASYRPTKAGPFPDVIVKMVKGRPTICSADGADCVSITSRVHLDVGGYNYRPNSAATNPQRLNDGVNARRARIGILGTFQNDWNYALVYDFGGSSDGFSTTNVGTTTTVSFLPGGAASGIENAYLSYTGFKPLGGKLAIEGGYMDVNYTLDEAISSNDIMFLERSSSQVIATNIAAGDFRSAFGARWYNDNVWVGSYLTGPTSGAIHAFGPPGAGVNSGATEQYGSTARGVFHYGDPKNASFHIGGDAQFLMRPPMVKAASGAVTQSLTLSDRPELRIDPTSILSTGSIAGVRGAQVYSVEAAGNVGALYMQGEYFFYNVDRLSDLATAQKFDGGYFQASYTLTGERRSYNGAAGAYGGITPANPFSLGKGGTGAIEIAGRISVMDLNNQLGLASGTAGGKQTVYTAGLNWYVNSNVRLMLNYLHGDIAKQTSAVNAADIGAKFDAVALRTQVAF